MFLQLKAVFACMAGVIAALATWLLVDASGLTGSEFIYHGDTAVGGDVRGFYLYEFVFSIFFALMTASADAIFRETPAQRRAEYALAIGCGLGCGLIGPGIGILFAGLYPAPMASITDASGPFLLNVLLLCLGWCIIGGVVGAVPGIARRSLWIAKRGAIGGALGTVVGAFLFHLSTSIFESDNSEGLAWRLGALILTGSVSALLATVVPDISRPVWLKRTLKSGSIREYTVARSPFRIGRDEGCDIVVDETPGIAPVHIVIEAIPQTNRHRLRHAARSPGGRAIYTATTLNGEPMTSEKWLTDGDKIRVGDLAFEFHDRATHVDEPEAPRIQDRPYEEDRQWELANKTTAIQRSILVVDEALPADKPTASVDQTTVTDAFGKLAPIVGQPTLAGARAGREDSATSSRPAAPISAAVDEAGAFRVIGTRLACIGGPYLGQSFPLSHETSLIGRSLDHAIALPADTSVSRVHARIVYEGGRHYISDFGSQNGLLVNDDLVTEPRRLQPADVIQVGATRLRYE